MSPPFSSSKYRKDFDYFRCRENCTENYKLNFLFMWVELYRICNRNSKRMRMTAFCDIASCSLVQVDRQLRDTYCLHHQNRPDDAVRTSEMFNFYKSTRRSIPEGCHLYTRSSDNLTFHEIQRLASVGL
jgi:hypothetical protein